MRFLLNLLVVLTLVTTATQGSMITFTHMGHGSGIIEGIPFPDSDFVITAHGDTTDRLMPRNDVWLIPHSSAFISIAGVGDFEFLTETFTFVNDSYSLVGFTRPTADLFDGPTDVLFATWDMLEPIGPIRGTGKLCQWDPADGYSPVVTTGGVLIFEDREGIETTFMAIPESCTLLFFALGGLLIRKRQLQ